MLVAIYNKNNLRVERKKSVVNEQGDKEIEKEIK